ncbi:MAG: SufD family Fe-S cluster assembly protein [Bdellovibrionota bacterium]
MTSLLEQKNKLAVCPKFAEESWKRTNPEIFFLPDGEVLNFQGQNALEYKNKLCPWKVCFREFKSVDTILQQIEKIAGKNSVEILKQESARLVVINITSGLADVYMSDELKSHMEFMSAPWDVEPISNNSPIAFALASRLKASSPHKIQVTVSTRQNEIPLIVVLNQCNPTYSQSYSYLDFTFKANTKADLMFIEGGASFAMSRHALKLEEHAVVNEFWLNDASLENNKCLYLERIIHLSENAKLKDAQLFKPKANMKIISRIQYNGLRACSESGGVVLANEGKFDYEPIQEHLAAHSKSNLNLKIILNNKAKASFQGLIVAHKEAQKCEAKQENKNILLSKLARIDSEPRLEILPHDISCKHGSATAEIDVKQLYYLQCKGFSLEQATQIIINSFAQSAFAFLDEESTHQKIVESTLNNAFL